MKAIALILLSFSFVFSANAQLSKGQWIVGGMGEFSHSNGDGVYNSFISGDSKTTQYAFSTGAGHFFTDRFCAGIRIGFGGTREEQDYKSSGTPFSLDYHSESKISTFNISPFARYYFLAPAKKINLLGEIAYVRTEGRAKSLTRETTYFPSNPPTINESSYTENFTSNTFSIGAGPAFFLNSKVSLELLVKYATGKISGSDQNSNAFGFATGFQIHLGK